MFKPKELLAKLGLGAKTHSTVEKTGPRDELRLVKVDAIKENPHQPRRSFSSDELEELARSIQEIGLIHHPVVRDLGDGVYELIAGERRLRALRLLKLTEISVVVRNSDEPYSAQSALVENIQRVDLNPIEIAQALRELMRDFHLTQEQLADRVGKKRSTVANYLRLLQLTPELQEAMRSGQISMGHAKALLSISGEKQQEIVQKILEDGLSVRQTEEKVRQLLQDKEDKPKVQDIYVQELQNQLAQRFGTKVTLSPQGQGGKISLTYYNLDDLDRLLQMLGIVNA